MGLKTIPYILIILCILTTGCTGSSRPLSDQELSARIRTILELPTVEYRYKDILYVGESRSFFFITTSLKEVLFSVDIRVRAGIDLQESFSVYRKKGNPHRIYVGLPPPKILLIDADESTIHQYFVLETGDRFRRLEYSKELEAAKPRILKDAQERGILAQAEQNAHLLVRGLMELLGFQEVEFLPSPRSGQGVKG